ncbi:LacI family DNA-binding transcriptional regulator [Streptomyces sp. NPDC050560]|uniref:LacI family DNA-binding transcriptional regulator n=1 Tax=Streptomyces sp. NPDC050560 TaxID=3365630 RepID=UPI00379DC594
MPKGQRPTAKDVAELAGVSPAAVSYVVNGRGDRFSAATRDRVLAAVEQLGYVPDSAARGLRRRRTDQICLVLGSVGVPATDVLVRQLNDEADRRGYSVLSVLVDSAARADRAFALLRRGIADGALVSDPYNRMDQGRLAALARNRLALVVMDNAVDPEGFDVVRTPEKRECGIALDHLVESGRRRIAFLGHDSDLRPGPQGFAERLDAYVEAHARHGLPRDPRLLVPGAEDRTRSYWAVTGLLQLEEPPDAIFCASDRAAISAVWAIRDAGRSVPFDVAVLGVGNLDEGLITRPALSTVGQPRLDFTGAIELLFDRLEADEPPPGREAVIPWSFIRRGTT